MASEEDDSLIFMKKLLRKILKVPQSNNVLEVEGIRLWYVSWYSRQGCCSYDVTKETEAFPSEEEAELFAQSLRNAFELLRHTNGNEVAVKRREN